MKTLTVKSCIHNFKSETFFDIDEFKYSDSLYDWSIDDLLKLNLNWYGYADLSVLHDLSASGLYANYKYKEKDENGNTIAKDRLILSLVKPFSLYL